MKFKDSKSVEIGRLKNTQPGPPTAPTAAFGTACAGATLVGVYFVRHSGGQVVRLGAQPRNGRGQQESYKSP